MSTIEYVAAPSFSTLLIVFVVMWGIPERGCSILLFISINFYVYFCYWLEQCRSASNLNSIGMLLFISMKIIPYLCNVNQLKQVTTMENYEKRFIKSDGNQRITFYREYPSDNPRYNTDEPLHCEDWNKDYSIMNKKECVSKSRDTATLLRYLLQRYGDNKKIIKALKDNYKSESHDSHDNALSYDRSRKEWIVWSWQPSWKDYKGNVYEAHWAEEWAFCINIYDVDLYNIVDCLSDKTIENFANKYITDEIKMMSYSFGYCGKISFSEDVSCNSEGICWLEKDEFLKYSGCDEDYWNGKALTEIEWLLDELVAWSIGDVYGYIVEDAIRSKVHKEYINADREDEDYEEEEWEEVDSCWGFYGELDNVISAMLDCAGIKKEELIDEYTFYKCKK